MNFLKITEEQYGPWGKYIFTKRKWIFLWAVTILLLFVNLGTGAISGSEGRWLSISHEMIANHDYLHPTINGQAYYDKPLVSYWLITGTAAFSNIFSFPTESVSEFSARVPSALAALLALFCVISIAERLFSAQTAYISAWIFMTTYSFVFWGRLAEADMENLAFILAATAWYWKVRKNTGITEYAFFWSICAVGAQTKGLAAFIIPGMLALIDMSLTKTFTKHVLNWRSYAGFLFGLIIYILPFLAASINSGDYSANGLVLVFRENIVRAFNPWDHKDEAWYMYFRHTAQLAAPWTPFLVLALASEIWKAIKKNIDKEELWLLLSFVAIFVFFAVSKSRRVYYILPIIPFGAMLSGRFLEQLADKNFLEKFAFGLIRILDWLIPVSAVVLLAAPAFFFPIYPAIVGTKGYAATPTWFIGMFCILLPTCGLLLGMFYFVAKRKNLPILERIQIFAACALLLIFGIMIPKISGNDFFRTERPFCREAHSLMFNKYRIPSENVIFWAGNYSNLVFYLDLPKPAAIFALKAQNKNSRSFFDDNAMVYGLADFRLKFVKLEKEGGAIISRVDRMKMMPEDLKLRLNHAILLMEPYDITEMKKVSRSDKVASVRKKKFLVYIFPSQESQNKSFEKGDNECK